MLTYTLDLPAGRNALGGGPMFDNNRGRSLDEIARELEDRLSRLGKEGPDIPGYENYDPRLPLPGNDR